MRRMIAALLAVLLLSAFAALGETSGDYIRYVAITESEYAEIEEQVTAGRYQVKMERMEGGIQ